MLQTRPPSRPPVDADDPRTLGNPGTPAFKVDLYPFYLLNKAVSRYNPLIASALKPVGVDIPSWRVLMILGEKAPRSISEIADAAVIHISTMTRIIQRMEEAGLIRCVIREDDHRVTDIHLSSRGQDRLVESRRAVAAIYDDAIAGFSREEFLQLIGLLERLGDNLANISG